MARLAQRRAQRCASGSPIRARSSSTPRWERRCSSADSTSRKRARPRLAREVLSIHRAHVEAGAELLLANTFGARPPTRAELTAALSLARKAGARYAAVALWTGLPTAELAETARAAAGAGADALWLETAMHADQACRALEAALGAGELPVAITLAFSAFPAGDAPADVYGPPLAQLASQGASVVGLNCGPWDAHGASGRTTELAVLVRALSSALPVPLALKPDAGARTPGAWAAAVADAARSGAALVGGCCGTGAPHLRALRDELANRANPRG